MLAIWILCGITGALPVSSTNLYKRQPTLTTTVATAMATEYHDGISDTSFDFNNFLHDSLSTDNKRRKFNSDSDNESDNHWGDSLNIVNDLQDFVNDKNEVGAFATTVESKSLIPSRQAANHFTESTTPIEFEPISKLSSQQKQSSKKPIIIVNGTIYPYNLSRTITTVPQLWYEYTSGFGRHPSVKQLEQVYGPNWRVHPSERAYYYSRKKVYDFIENLIDDGHNEGQLVSNLENFRLTNSLSLVQLQQQIPNLILYSNGTIINLEIPPFYTQSRNFTTVKQVWKEFADGIDGNPSVRQLEQKFGNEWRISKPDSMFFYRRRKIYDYVEDEIANGKSADQVVQELDDLKTTNGWTLSQLQNHLRTQMSANASEEFIVPEFGTQLWKPPQN